MAVQVFISKILETAYREYLFNELKSFSANFYDPQQQARMWELILYWIRWALRCQFYSDHKLDLVDPWAVRAT